MLLGCCHCGSPPSESTPPSQSVPPSASQSQSQSNNPSSEGSNPRFGCTHCIGSVQPAVMKATIGYTGTGGGLCCASYNQAQYLLYPTSGCDYESTERALNGSPGFCTAQADSRVALQYTGSAMRLTYRYYDTGTLTRIVWEKSYTSGLLECLIPHTLTYVRLNFFAPALPRRWSNLSPCATSSESVPLTVTIGPA